MESIYFSILIVVEILILISIIGLCYYLMNVNKELSLNKQSDGFRLFFIVSIIISLVGFGVFFWFLLEVYRNGFDYDKNEKIFFQKFGLIGDFTGGVVGVFFSIVGVFLLFETLRMQRKESRENRKFLYKQQFENNFYQLINVHSNIVNNIKSNVFDDYPDAIGKDFFDELAERISIDFEGKSRKFDKKVLENDIVTIKPVEVNPIETFAKYQGKEKKS